MKIDIIDKYLAGEMSDVERQDFEQEMEQDAKLKEDVRLTAYIIHGIKVMGLEEDNERLQRLITTSKTDHRRYVATIAALFVMGLAFADIISIPIYQLVVKPIMEMIYDHDSHKNNDQNTFTTDTIITHQDSESPSTKKPTNVESEKESPINKNKEEEELVSQVDVIEDIEQEEYQEQEEEQIPSNGYEQSVDIGENGTRYAIDKAQMKGNVLVITISISNDEDDDIINLGNVSLVDSYGDTYTGNAPNRLLLKQGIVVKKQLYFYNVSKKPDFIQIIKMKEQEGRMLQFRNITVS